MSSTGSPQQDQQQAGAGGTVALLGAGVMGETVLAGMLRAGRDPASVRVVEKRAERADELRERHGVEVVGAAEAVAAADVVLLVTKPGDLGAVLEEVSGSLRPDQVVVSLAAGVTTAFVEERVPEGTAVVRVMPNTPATVDRGAYVVSPGSAATDEHLELVEGLVSATGRVVRVPEGQQDAATALSGSGPAYVFLVLEAMVEAGVHLGLPRATARELGVQTVLGAATLASEGGEHPGLLREAVTSPGGTTAAALGELERHGLRAAFLDALTAARDRSRDLAGG